MQVNKQKPTIKTHEGAKAKHISDILQLRRSVMACMLWEGQFYESGVEIAGRIQSLVPKVAVSDAVDVAIEAREQMKLRHVPLLIARELARHPSKEARTQVGDLLERIIQRPDELGEFVALYWKDGKQPLSAQVKKGLAKAFTKFDPYQLAKYNRQDKDVTLRDVLFLVHPDPKSDEQEATWKALAEKTLESPDTWEVALSSGADKKETFTRLLSEGKLGALALLRNLRNMREAGVGKSLIREALSAMNVSRVLPFRFITAARHAVGWEPELEQAMFKAAQTRDKLPGHTVIVADVSYSMHDRVSGKSEVSRIDAACGIAMIAREMCDEVTVLTFSNSTVQVPSRRGFALRDAINNSQEHSGTMLGDAVREANKISDADRLIVITDEQSHQRVPDSSAKRAYMINVASYKNGVGYGKWTHLDGFSEAVLDYIQASEVLNLV